MIALQRLDKPSKEQVKRRPLNRVYEDREVAGFRQIGNAAGAHALGQALSNGVVVRCTQQRAPHVVCTWHFVVGGRNVAGVRSYRHTDFFKFLSGVPYTASGAIFKINCSLRVPCLFEEFSTENDSPRSYLSLLNQLM